MQTTINKDVRDYLSLTQYLVAKGELRIESSTAFDAFVGRASAEELRLIITTYSSCLDVAVNDAIKRKKFPSVNPSLYAVETAKSFNSYSDYVKNITESTIPSNMGVAIQSCYKGEEEYEVHYDLAKLETYYQVGKEVMTFQEILKNINQIAASARTPIRIVDTKMSSRLVACVEGGTATSVESSNVDTLRIRGVSTMNLGKAINDGTMGMAPHDLVSNFTAPDNNIRCNVDGSVINVEMKSQTFHRGVDVHEVLPNGRVKAAYYAKIKLDVELEDKQRRQYTEKVLKGEINSDYVFFNFSWIQTWINDWDGFEMKMLGYWMPVLIPGSADVVLRRMTQVVNLWNVSGIMMTLVRTAKRIHYIWCMLRSLTEKVNIYHLVDLITTKMEMKMAAPLKVMFSIFRIPLTIKVDVSKTQNTVSEIVVGIVKKLQNVLDDNNAMFEEELRKQNEERPIEVHRDMNIDFAQDVFYGTSITSNKASVQSRLTGSDTIKSDMGVQHDVKEMEKHEQHMQNMTRHSPLSYQQPTLPSNINIQNPPPQITIPHYGGMPPNILGMGPPPPGFSPMNNMSHPLTSSFVPVPQNYTLNPSIVSPQLVYRQELEDKGKIVNGTSLYEKPREVNNNYGFVTETIDMKKDEVNRSKELDVKKEIDNMGLDAEWGSFT